MPFTPLQSNNFTPVDTLDGFASASQPKKGMLQKATDIVGSIFPGKKVGESIGTLAGLGLTKAKETLGVVPKGTTEQFDISSPSTLQVAGDIAMGATQVAGLKAPMPTSPTILGSIGKTALQTGALSAVSGAGQKASEGGSSKDIAKNAFTSGLTGAVVGGAIGGIAKTVSKLAEKAPTAIYNNVLKVNQRIKDAGKSPDKFLNNEKIWGGLGTFKKASEEGIQQAKTAIEPKLASTPGSLTWETIKSEALAGLKKEFGKLYSDKQLLEVIDSVPAESLKGSKEGLNWLDSNVVREQLDKMLGDRFYLSSANPSVLKSATSKVTNALRTNIQKATGTEQEFAKYSQWLRTKKLVDRAIEMADKKYGIGLFDTIAGGVGVTAGAMQGESPSERIKGAVIGGAGSVAIERVLTSPAFQTFVAQKLQTLPVDSLGKISRNAIVDIAPEIADFINNQ